MWVRIPEAGFYIVHFAGAGGSATLSYPWTGDDIKVFEPSDSGYTDIVEFSEGLHMVDFKVEDGRSRAVDVEEITITPATF